MDWMDSGAGSDEMGDNRFVGIIMRSEISDTKGNEHADGEASVMSQCATASTRRDKAIRVKSCQRFVCWELKREDRRCQTTRKT